MNRVSVFSTRRDAVTSRGEVLKLLFAVALTASVSFGAAADQDFTIEDSGGNPLFGVDGDTGEVAVQDGNLSLSTNSIEGVSRINGQLVQNLGTSSLSEILNEGNTASNDIDLNGNNLTDSTRGNVTIAQDLAVYGKIYYNGTRGDGVVTTRDINLTGKEIVDTQGSVTLGGGSVDIPDGNLDMGSNTITGLPDSFSSSDAVDKEYVDNNDDFEANTDTQDLSINGDTISLDRGGSVSITDNVQDGDTDDTNELQDLEDVRSRDNTLNGNIDMNGNKITSSGGELCVGKLC